MFETLWKRHYFAEVTESYHGDMARAFKRMMADPEASEMNRVKMRHATEVHMWIERSKSYEGRKWFCEVFGKPHERMEVE